MAQAPADPHALALGKIATRMHEIFDGQIDLSEFADKTPEHIEPHFRTRALAALALMDEAGVPADIAGSCVTDGGADDGIDAVFVDNDRQVVYFVQSKWRSAANKSIDLSDFTKFRDGVRSVLSLEWTHNNANIHKFKNELEGALSNIDTRIVLIFAYTSEQKIADNIQSRIQGFIDKQNSIVADFMELRSFTLKRVAQAAQFQSRPENIGVTALLEHWGLVREPYAALYGAISAVDVVSWFEAHGTRLFAENLRYTIDKSSVNDGIIDTAEKEPQNFWYFNNGITAICDSFHKQPMGGDATDKGVFDVKRISVINGAQTIGSLAKAKAAGAKLEKAKVHIRIVSLVDTPDGFSVNVTNANNTQNNLSPMDFVAADPAQDRLRKEASDIGLSYAFRRGDATPDEEKGFDIRSATIAAACASGELRFAVASKRYISGLWRNTKEEPYTKLFNDKTSAQLLWYVVRIMRSVDQALAKAAANLRGRDKLIAVHGNRFILFYVFEKFKGDGKFSAEYFLENSVGLDEMVEGILCKVIPLVNELFPEDYPGNVFKNNDMQIKLLANLKQEMG